MARNGDKENGCLKIRYTKKAANYIEGLDRPTKQRIRKAVEGLTE